MLGDVDILGRKPAVQLPHRHHHGDGDVGKDDVTGAEKKLDSITKKYTDTIDELLKNKEAELLEV